MNIRHVTTLTHSAHPLHTERIIVLLYLLILWQAYKAVDQLHKFDNTKRKESFLLAYLVPIVKCSEKK